MNFPKKLLVAGLIGVSCLSSAQVKEKVTISEGSFTGAKAVSYVLKAVIEKRLGGVAEIKLTPGVVAFSGMDKGDGQLDVLADTWMPNMNASWAEYVEKKKTVVSNTTPYKGIQRLWIPGYIQDQYKVYSLEDLRRPEVAKLFDSDNNGKGEYWPGAPGWGSTQIWQIKMRTSGLDQLYEAQIVDQTIFLNKLDSEYKKKKALLFYYWTPEWVPQAYDIRPLKEAPFTGYKGDNAKDSPLFSAEKGCFEFYTPKETQDWLEKSKITCQNPDAEIWVSYSKSLVERAPKAAQFLKQVKFDPEEVSKWITAIARDKKDAQDVAEEWVASHKSIVDEWVRGIK